MDAIGKIGVIIPYVMEQMEHELIYGIHSQARKLGYDVLIFSDVCNLSDDDPQNDNIKGLENIYHLALKGKLDGVLFAASRFRLPKLKEKLYKMLKVLSVPCLVLEEETYKFSFHFVSQKESVKRLTEHLIQEHNCRKLYCLSGIKGNYVSDERTAGFFEAMEEAGLAVDESHIFEGYFWRDIPTQIGKDIADGVIPRPDGIVCINDVMATAICKSLQSNHISVPDDIAVTGFDGAWSAYINQPQITTISGGNYDLGASAMCRLYEMMTGRECRRTESKQNIMLGTSCGCSACSSGIPIGDCISANNYISRTMGNYLDRKSLMMYSNWASVLSDVDTLEQLSADLASRTFLYNGVKSTAICMCEDWMFDFENPEFYRIEGFSDKMLLSYSRHLSDTLTSGVWFNTESMLPELENPHEPMMVIFTSLHYGRQIFGYIATAYETVQTMFLDDKYIHWCDAIAYRLDTLQRKNYKNYIKQQMKALSIYDASSGLYNERGMLEHLPEFRRSCKRNHLNCICLLISHAQNSEKMQQTGVDPSLVIANALKLSSDGNELICRLQDTAFAVILQSPNEDYTQTAQQRIMLLEERIRDIQGDKNRLILITDCQNLQFDKIGQVGDFIEQRLRLLMDKTESMVKIMGNYKQQFLQLRRRIFSSPQNDWNIDKMAASIGVSRSHFQRTYKAEFGVSFHDDIIDARIKKAKKLLLHTDLKIHEISDQCGYTCMSHFMRQFKKRVGLTATQFKLNGKDN